MGKIAATVYFFTKRQLKQVSFLGILLLFSIFTLLFAQSSQTEDPRISVALYTPVESENTASFDLVQKLSATNGNFTFYHCDSEEELYTDVSTAKAECGYIFPTDLFEKLDLNKKNNLVDVVVSPSTTMNKIINEVVYAEVFEEYSLHLLTGYLLNESPLSADFPQALSPGSLEHEIETLYRSHMTDGSTFSFAYHTKATNLGTDSSEKTSLLLTPIRGLIAVFIFLSGFCGATNYYKDSEAHVFDNRTLRVKHSLRLLSISIPVFLSSAAGFLCLVSADLSQGILPELIALFAYSLLVIVFCTTLSLLVPNTLLFSSLIPIFMLGSLIFTPVFIDVAIFLPALKPVSRLFIPYYYFLLCP